jgi:hypothetical protein
VTRPQPQPDSTIERFKVLLKTLLSVSKKELEEAIEAEKRPIDSPKNEP